MKRIAKHTTFLLAAALLLSGCKTNSESASDEQSGVSLVMETASDKRFSCELDGVKCSLNKPFGLDFEYKKNLEISGYAIFTGWLAGGFDEPICVTLQYAEGWDDFDKSIDVMAKSEKKKGELTADWLDIKQTDSGQDIFAYSYYVYKSEENDVSYSLFADSGNGGGIYLTVTLDGERNTPEALEETLALFRSLKWEPTDSKILLKNNVFEFEDAKFTMKIPEDTEYSECSDPLESSDFKRAVRFVGETPVSMSYFECAEGGSFERYKSDVLQNIEKLSGGNISIVDPIKQFYTDDLTRAYKWTYRADGKLTAEAFYPIDDTSWIAVTFYDNDESKLQDFEKSLESFVFLKKPEPKCAALDLSKSERPELTRVKIDCNARLQNMYKVHVLHTEVVGLFGCPIRINGKIPDKTALTFTYDPSLLNGINPKGLVVLHYNEKEADYKEITPKLDEERCTVTAEISEDGDYMLVDAYEWFRAWGAEIDELRHDLVFRCGEVTPNFSITIPAEVDYTPCGDYLKESGEPNLLEKDLVAGPSSYDKKHKIVLSMKYCERTDGLTYAENIAGLKAAFENVPNYNFSVYEETKDRVIFIAKSPGEPEYNIGGIGNVWTLIKMSDSSWLNIGYSYDYNNISKYEQTALNSIKSFKWE